MKAFVTGGAGFIGSHMVDRLIEEGHEVFVYDNLSSGKIEFIEQHIKSDGFSYRSADLLNRYHLRCMKDCDIVFHFAANPDARKGIEDTSLDLYQETIATYNVLESMRLNGIKKIVFASSGTIYGETPVMPIPENYGPVLPISLYGAGKMASEGLISAFCHTFGMQAWIFRFANIIGDRATHGVIYDFVRKLMKNPEELEILGDGNQEKPYVMVDECVNGILYGLEHSNDRVNVLNIGTPTSIDVNSIARIVIEEMGLKDVKLKYTGGDRGWPGDVPQVRFDTGKMERLGWKTKCSSEEAVRTTTKLIIQSL